DIDQLVWVAFVDLDIEHIETAEFLEQDRLALHDRFGRHRADVAQPQHGTAIGDDTNQVAAVGVAHRLLLVLDDLLAGPGHTRRIRQRQIALVAQRLGGDNGGFAGYRVFVIIKRGLARIVAQFDLLLTLPEAADTASVQGYSGGVRS